MTSRPGSVSANAQRVVISIADDGVGGAAPKTDVITEIAVPETTADYGALLPVPLEPTLDPEPIATDEIERLDEATAPQLIDATESDGGFGCGCMGTAASDAGSKGANGGSGVQVSKPVNIGPVTATVLSGSSEAIGTWLSDNGFAIAAEHELILSEFSSYHFIALRRSETAAPGGPTSVGLHYSVPGDYRELPLRFARVGAAPSVAFTLIFVANETLGPSLPFVPLTLDDLDSSALKFGSYAAAVQGAVRRQGNRAFVLESSQQVAELPFLGARLNAIVRNGSTITRMSTILPAEALTEDASFYTPYDDFVPNERFLTKAQPFGAREASLGVLAVLVFAGAWRRRTRAT